jgi:uncharacterized protein (DUF2235 family)
MATNGIAKEVENPPATASSNYPAGALQNSPKRLVLCFDGTSNKFNGDASDTNIVKIYEMFDRSTNDQFHYYQRKLTRTTPVSTTSLGGEHRRSSCWKYNY